MHNGRYFSSNSGKAEHSGAYRFRLSVPLRKRWYGFHRFSAEQGFTYRLLATQYLHGSQFRVFPGSSPFYRLYYLEAAPLQYFPECFHYSARLVIEDIKRVRSGAGTYYDCFLPLWSARGIPHAFSPIMPYTIRSNSTFNSPGMFPQ